MSISEPFIRRPIGTSLLMLGVLVFGIGAYGLLPVAPLPNVDFPTITVTASYPGASPQTMASAIATPLEQQFTQIPALDQMTSLSGIGTTTITLQFDLSRNIDGAAVDVVTAINAAAGLLPKDLPSPPTYRKVNPADFPIMIFAVHSDAVPDYRLDDYANTVLGERLSTVPGVGQVSIFGQKLYAARVQVNPAALGAHGIGLEDVRSALVNATVNEPKGTIEGSDQVVALETNDQLFNADAYGNIIIAYRNGAPVRIKDVGNALDSVQNARVGAWFNNKPAEGIAIQKAPGANTVALVDTIKALMPKLQQSIPPAVHVDLMLDRTLVTRAAVRDVQLTMMLTISLVVIVIFLFLRTLWATVIPSLAVPLSLLATFSMMYIAGFSLDNISLMALTISVGFVVDDAIVMIENIVRYIEQGMTPFEAALKGAGQIGFTIISITFSLIAVFIPLFAMGGIIGRLFREFAITVSVAVVASAIVSLTLTPVMCSLFLKEQGLHPKGRFNRGAERFFERIIGAYDRGLNFVFRHQFAALVSTLLLMVATGYLYVKIPKGFFPQQDTGTVFGEIDTRQDASFLKTVKMAHEIVDIVRNDPSVGGVFMLAGAYAYNPTENAARVFFALKPFEERSDTANQVVQRLRQKVQPVEGAIFYMQVPQNITVGGRLSRTQYQYTLTDTNDAELNHWAPILEGEMRKLPELQDVASDQQNAAPTMTIDVDRDAAYRLGLSASLIDQTLYDAFGQRQVATIYTATNQYKVVLEVQPEFRSDRTALSKIYVAGQNGAQVPLSAVAHFTSKVSPLSVSHQGVFPAVTLSFNLAPGVALGQAVEKIQQMAERLRAPPTLNASFQGTAQAFQASLSSMPLLVAAAILVVYIVLGVLYESYIHPITILSALPSAGVGALLMLMLFHYDLSVIALVGVILLIGIVKKNAIMMIDFALQAERLEGKSPREAIHQACLLRFRPIMMTTFAALFGAMPIAFGQGAGFLVHDVSRLIKRRFERGARQMALPITRQQAAVMLNIASNEGVSQAEVAAWLDIEPIALVRMLDKLHEEGLVERRAHPTDRRIRTLWLTKAAHPVVARILAINEAIRQEAFAGLPPATRDVLTAGRVVLSHIKRKGRGRVRPVQPRFPRLSRERFRRLAAGSIIAAAALTAPLDPTGGAEPTEVAENEIRSAIENWRAAFNARDEDRVCALFASDLVANYQGEAERDYASLCEMLRAAIRDPDVAYRYSVAINEIVVYGEAAVVRLVWALEIVKAGSPKQTIEEPAADIFHRQADGSWKISRYLAYPASR